jgi:hypothetical protein
MEVGMVVSSRCVYRMDGRDVMVVDGLLAGVLSGDSLEHEGDFDRAAGVITSHWLGVSLVQAIPWTRIVGQVDSRPHGFWLSTYRVSGRSPGHPIAFA